MSRPRSDTKRAAILEAASRVISAQGLAGATTSAIAKEASVSNGTLFVYFDTKTVLLNDLYVVLKTEMGDAASASLPSSEPVRKRVQQMWAQWLSWATANPEKRRALAQLEVAEDITSESHLTVHDAQRDMAELIERARSAGPMAATPSSFVMALISAIADATMDALIRDPGGGDDRAATAFEAVWRVLAG